MVIHAGHCILIKNIPCENAPKLISGSDTRRNTKLMQDAVFLQHIPLE